MRHVKRTKAKGKEYLYFRTGRLDKRGKEILSPLPALKDPGFDAAYGSFLAGRSRRDNAQAAAAAELTVPALCDLYEQSDHFRRKLSPGSQRLYSISIRYFRAMLPTAPAGLLERKDVVLLVDGRATQPGAANSLLRTIAAIYRWARERGHVENEPCRDIAELAMGEHDPWPEHIVDAALIAKDDRTRLAVHLLLYTAQRIGDVVKMKWTDIRAGRITVTQQKTDQSLSIMLHSALVKELARHPQSLGYIIAGQRGRPLDQSTLREHLQAFAAEHGVKIVPHGLRKNAVNALLEAGCSAAETAAISGQSLGMVEHYAKARSQPKLGDTAVLKWQGHRA